MPLRCLLLLFTFAFACGTAVAQSTTKLYKSTGPDGKIIYSDQPPAGARDARTLTFQNEPATPLSPATVAHIERMAKSADARAAAAAPHETTLFTAVWCGYCRQAKAHLAARQVPYREFDIDTPDGLAAFARAGGRRGVPLLLVDGKSVSGFSSASYDAMFAPRK